MKGIKDMKLGKDCFQTRGEAGVSLIEMTIAMVILSIVISSAYSVVGAFFKQSVSLSSTYNAQDQVQLVTEGLTSDLRAAVTPQTTLAVNPAFSSAQPVPTEANPTTFFASLGAKVSIPGVSDNSYPSKVSIYLVPTSSARSSLFLSVTPPSAPISANGTATYGQSVYQSELASDVVSNPDGMPLLTYCSPSVFVAGNPLAPGENLGLISNSGSSGPVADSLLGYIATVNLELTVQAPGGMPITAKQVITMENYDLNPSPSVSLPQGGASC
ncbi:MAG: prepilin-type N-terminal cleavage/methylation domain-containing protein [Actinobacteria bacterium]|nr:prepilin-type N-terminal cleavage/methylation domain-containing protein [Actinomycetota bacterium]MCL6105662.1 prepilin-type N-terminal cleavage/methylation domain-containing protein [Actinomycetota bacterium]